MARASLTTRAMENFIDQEAWESLGCKLTRLALIHNIDRTENIKGQITHYCWLKLVMNNQLKGIKFYLTSLGSDQIILVYPFLWEFNLKINWRNGEILDGQLLITTLVKENANEPIGFQVY